MSGNTNPDQLGVGDNLVEGHFTSFDATTEALISTIGGLARYYLLWTVSDSDQELVPAPTPPNGSSFVPVEMIMIAKDDLSPMSGTFTISSGIQTAIFNWSDVSTVNSAGKLARIMLDGFQGFQGDANAGVRIVSSVDGAGFVNAYVYLFGFFNANE